MLSDSCALSVSDYVDALSEHGGGEDYGPLFKEPDIDCGSATTDKDYNLSYDTSDVEEELDITSKAEDIEDLTDAVLSTSNGGVAVAGIGNSQTVMALPTALSSIRMISVFWDIENCAVPSGVAAYKIVQKVRQQFYTGHREADFIVACDILRMKTTVVSELSEAHVTVIHVPGDQKNAADDKLRTMLRRFSEAYKLANSRIVLISGDVDFAAEIHEIRYRDLIHVVLIHNDQAKRALTDSASESICYSEFVSDLKKAALTADIESESLKQTTMRATEETAASVQKKLSVKKLPTSSQRNNAQVPDGIAVAKKKAGSGDADETSTNTFRSPTKEKQPEMSSQVCAKIGLLATAKHQKNELYWRSLLSKTSIPQGFSIEVGSAGNNIVCLVYPSTNKAKKAVAILNKLAASGSDMPVCLGIQSDKVVAEERAMLGPDTASSVKKIKAAMDAHQAKVEAIKKQAACIKGYDQKAKEECMALQKLADAYAAQLREFTSTVSKCPSSLQEADAITATEVARLRRSSAVYGVKSKLLDGLNKRQVVFLVTSTGSGVSLEVPSYLQDLGCRVLSIQPSEFAAEQCTKCAGSINALGPSECWTISGEPPSPKSKVVFTTARHFFQEFLRCGTALAGFQAIVVDGLQEDGAYQHVALAVLRKHFVSQVRLVLCSTESDVSVAIQESFCLGAQDIVRCVLKFPVDIVWKEQPASTVAACIAVALEFCQKESCGGDVLVFLPSLRDAFMADAMLEHRKHMGQLQDSVRHEVLHPGKAMLSKVSALSSSWRVLFAVECPDACASMLQVRCVVDSGLVQTVVSRNGILVVQLACISEAEAEQRRALAGIRQQGTCYRLYTQDTFVLSLPAEEKNSRFMEDIVFRVSARQTSTMTSFLEKVPKEQLKSANKLLAEIGALDASGRLTDLGAKLCSTGLEPRLGKLIVGSLGRASSLHGILLSILALEDLRAAYRVLNKDGSERSLPLSEGDSGFSRIIEMYKNWLVVPKKMKSMWCEVNGINEAFINYLHSSAQAVQSEFDVLKGKNLCASLAGEERNATVTMGQLLAESFPEGWLQASERGYCHPTLGSRLQVSPLTLFDRRTSQVKNAICCLFSKARDAKKLQILNFSSLADKDKISQGDPAIPLQLGKPANQNFQERFGPIGNLIWNCQFASTNALKLTEEKLRSLKNDVKGSLALDPVKQCIIIAGHKQYCIEARRYLQGIVTDQVARLAKKDREALLTPHDSAYSTQPVLAVIGIGGQVDELLSPTNFRTIVIGDVKSPLPEFRKRVNELGDIVQYWFLKKEEAFQITYKTAKEASAAYSALSKQVSELTVFVKGQALEYREEQRNQRPAFHAKISLPRRRCTGIAFAELPDQASFDRITGSLPLCLQLDGAVVTCERNKKVPCQLYIKGLPSTVSQVTVEKVLQASLCSRLKSVRLIHEPAFETSQEQLQAFEGAIQKAFEREPGVGRPRADLKIPKSGDYIFEGWMSFEDAVVAQSACALLKGATVTTNDGSATLPLTIHPLVEGVFFFPCSFFVAIQRRVTEELGRQEGLRPEDNLKCDAKPCGDVVRMSLRANNLNDFHKVVQLFNRLLTSEAARVESSLNMEMVASVAKAAAPGRGIYVYHKPGDTRLVGEKELVNTAIEMLRKSSRAQAKYSRKYLTLVGGGSTMLRSFVARFGNSVTDFIRECNLDVAKFQDGFKSVKVIGTDAAVARAEELVRQLDVRRVQAEPVTDAEDRCPVCLEPPGKGEDPVSGHRLELCGHWHCKSCLLLVLGSGPLPLACFEEDCGTPWAIADICHVTGNNPGLLSDLARRSFECCATADVGGRWWPCPTPECHFALDASRDAEEQGVCILGDVHVCPGCTNAVCFRCRSLYHYGMSCAAYRTSMSLDGISDKSWLSVDPGKRMVCPACKTRLERSSSGKSKVGACWACRRLLCWRCHQCFEDDAAAARGHRTLMCCQVAPRGRPQ